jgi:serine/threonine-protein kinase
VVALLLTLALGAGAAAARAEATREVSVPNVVGLAKTTAQTRLRTARLRPHAVYVKSLKNVGTVVAERPRAGTKAKTGTRVTISVSRGPGP